MYYCETPGSACTTVTDKTGYFVNSDLANKGTVPYIECTADTDGAIACKGIGKPTGTCSTTTSGSLVIDSEVVKLCLDGTNKIEFGSDATAKNYLVGYSTKNIYKDAIVENKYGVVAVNNHAMVINTTFQADYGICVNTDGEVASGITSAASGPCSSPVTKSNVVDFCYGGVCFLTCKVTVGTNCKFFSIYY